LNALVDVYNILIVNILRCNSCFEFIVRILTELKTGASFGVVKQMPRDLNIGWAL
jgi:hypothetical protein